jgi:ferric-dicitrate binding protein FerR (iron transport regulator)
MLTDTAPDIDQYRLEQWRQMSPARKLAQVARMRQTVQTLALSGLRQRHPADTDQTRQRRLAALMLGPALAAQAYGKVEEAADAV